MFLFFKTFLLSFLIVSCVKSSNLPKVSSKLVEPRKLENQDALIINVPDKFRQAQNLRVIFKCSNKSELVVQTLNEESRFSISDNYYIFVQEPADCLVDSVKLVFDNTESDWIVVQ